MKSRKIIGCFISALLVCTAALFTGCNDIENTYNLNISVLEPGYGNTFSVTVSGRSVSTSAMPIQVQAGERVMVVAISSGEYSFSQFFNNGLPANATIDDNFLIFDMPASAVTILIDFEIKIPGFAVSFNPSPNNGTVTVAVNGNPINSGNTVEAGETIIVTAAPNNGFTLNNFTITGASFNETSGNERTFIMPENAVTVNVTFRSLQAFILNQGSATNGTLSGFPGSAIHSGTYVSITASPNTGFGFNTFTITGWDNHGLTLTDNPLEFEMPALAGIIIGATFAALPTNPLNIIAPSGGTILASVDGNNITSGSQVRQGDTVTITASPASGTFTFNSWHITGAEVTNVNNAVQIFIMPNNEVRIAATFNEAGRTIINYCAFGAVGDGVTCDFLALRAAHEEANRLGRLGYNVLVRATPGVTYYIGDNMPLDRTQWTWLVWLQEAIRVETDTDWTGAYFIIDDTQVRQQVGGSGAGNWIHDWIFHIASRHEPINLPSITAFNRHAPSVNATLPSTFTDRALVEVEDRSIRRFIRMGENANQGSFQLDVFIIDRNGIIDQRAPVLWDFPLGTPQQGNHIRRAWPIDETTLYITGGHFTTIANTGTTSGWHYMARGIYVRRSNTVIDGITHRVINEPVHIPGSQLRSFAYMGFILVENTYNVQIINSSLYGRRTHWSQTGGGALGTYGLVVNNSINFIVRDTDQGNSITNTGLWGIFMSNFSKNILFDNVTFSRFDAHGGVYNVTIKNSDIGHHAVRTVGFGDLIVINTTVRASAFIGLRGDFGSFWDGNVYIRNGTLVHNGTASVIDSNNPGNHWFGYPTMMPRNVFIDGFNFQTTGANTINLVAGRAPQGSDPYPHALTERIVYRNFTRNGVTHTPSLPSALSSINRETPGLPADWNW